MKKFIDSPSTLLSSSLQGFARAHAEQVVLHSHPSFITRRQSKLGKVALISGGSGHEPLHSGFVGFGMLDAACPGQIFTSPTPDQMLAAAQAVDSGAGVLFIVKNYAGDVMNFEMAAEMLEVPCATVLVADDVALPKDHPIGRRGVAGTAVVEKIVGAAAETGLDLAACQAIGQQVADATASMGVALSSCTVPALGHPTFELADNAMELGVGIHGERGRETLTLSTASNIVEQLLQPIEAALGLQTGDTVLLHVNGLGATPLLELHLIYELAWQYCNARGITVVRSLVGNFTTALDMVGCSITVTRMDASLEGYWDAPVNTPALRWGC
jgi:dihydroxyacetone kinase-like protein